MKTKSLAPLTGHQSDIQVSRGLAVLLVVLFHAAVLFPGGYVGGTARALGATLFLSERGILTPFASPLAEGHGLLAWSSDNAEYWTHSRPDVKNHVAGRQMLQAPTPEWTGDENSTRPTEGITYLGQFHGHKVTMQRFGSVDPTTITTLSRNPARVTAELVDERAGAD